MVGDLLTLSGISLTSRLEKSQGFSQRKMTDYDEEFQDLVPDMMDDFEDAISTSNSEHKKHVTLQPPQSKV
jgi:hypothetical protein